MQVHRASDGATFELQQGLREYESLQELVTAIEAFIEIKPENILLFLEDGRELKQQRLQEAWSGQGSSTAQERDAAIYVFDRESFWTDPAEWCRGLEEGLIELGDPEDLETYLAAQSHIQHLHALFTHQSRALRIAHQSLAHHLEPLTREFTAFAEKAQAAIQKEEALLKGSAMDLAMLPKIGVHEAFLAGKKAKTLGDYVHANKMKLVRDGCRVTLDDHQKRFSELRTTVEELEAGAAEAGRLAENKVREVEDELQDGLATIEDIISIFDTHEFAREAMLDLYQQVGQLVEAATIIKNNFTLELHLHLAQIAAFQSTITTIVPPLTSLDADLRSKGGFPHLYRLHNLPFAYAATVIEVVRRKEFSQFFLERTSALAEALAKVVNAEKKRRTTHRNEVLALLPWDLGPLIEGPGPSVEMSVVGGGEGLMGLNLGRADIQELLKLLDSLEVDPEIQDAVEEGQASPIPAMRTTLVQLMAKLDGVAHDFDKAAERAVLSTARARRQCKLGAKAELTLASTDLHAMQELADQLRDVETAKQEQEKAAESRAADCARRERKLREQHDEQLETVQRRQAELQEELARLRHDMGEVATELEDKQREVDENAELVSGLQADFAQEKSRVNDLGVRLQEALLDVDGVRGQEDSLRLQLDELRSERSTALRQLSEAHMQRQDRESQVAGLRAEISTMSDQLVQARSDRDAALQQQSADAERMMRDHITEADGDRAVLEHQNLTLTSELERLKAESDTKIAAIKNTATRERDGLKAELAFAKAQLRESTRRETITADELATAKDVAAAATQKETSMAEKTREAVGVALTYHECNVRLQTAINASATISGMASTTAARPASPPLSDVSGDEHSESVLADSLAAAAAFDLEAFADAVTKTMNLVRKWQKSCKQYREQAKHKIAFSNFAKGDLALFLPTRNSTAKSWAAFNISAPHNFLRMTDAILERMQGRDFVVARIVKTEELMVTSDPDSNPYGLAEGLRYSTHTVEEYDPAMTKSRRTLSTGREASTPCRQGPLESVASPMMSSPSPAPSRRSSGYFPSMGMTSAALRVLDVNEPVVIPVAIPAPSRPLRLSSRNGSSAALSGSPNVRDHVSFSPAVNGRPASVASSSSSYPGKGIAGPKSKASPAMATTTTHGLEIEDLAHQFGRQSTSSTSYPQIIATQDHAEGAVPPSVSPSSIGFASSLTGTFRNRTGSSSKRPTTSLAAELEGSHKGSAADLLKRLDSKG